MAINFTMWIFDIVGVPNREDDISSLLNTNYLGLCTDGTVAATNVRWAASGDVIAPAKYDAVVFLISNPKASLTPLIGGNATRAVKKDTVRGLTTLGATGGGLAEVYWDRCYNLNSVASSIFHEAAHLKSGKDDAMHNTPGVSILSERGGFDFPTWEDLDFFSAAIKRPITLRRRVPV